MTHYQSVFHIQCKKKSYNHILFFLCLSLVDPTIQREREQRPFVFRLLKLFCWLHFLMYSCLFYRNFFGLENGNLSVACQKPVGNLSADSWPTVSSGSSSTQILSFQQSPAWTLPVVLDYQPEIFSIYFCASWIYKIYKIYVDQTHLPTLPCCSAVSWSSTSPGRVDTSATYIFNN